jgi:hypothetical protein
MFGSGVTPGNFTDVEKGLLIGGAVFFAVAFLVGWFGFRRGTSRKVALVLVAFLASALIVLLSSSFYWDIGGNDPASIEQATARALPGEEVLLVDINGDGDADFLAVKSKDGGWTEVTAVPSGAHQPWWSSLSVPAMAAMGAIIAAVINLFQRPPDQPDDS